MRQLQHVVIEDFKVEITIGNLSARDLVQAVSITSRTSGLEEATVYEAPM